MADLAGQFIKHLRQVKSMRGGRFVAVVVLVTGAFLFWGKFSSWATGWPKLEGTMAVAYSLVAAIGIGALFVGVGYLVLSKPQLELDNGAKTGANGTAAEGRLVRVNRRNILDLLSRYFVLGWGLLIAGSVYVIGWVVLWRDAIYPHVVQHFDLDVSTTQSILNLFLGFMVISFWLILPFVLLLEIRKEIDSRKYSKNHTEKQRH